MLLRSSGQPTEEMEIEVDMVPTLDLGDLTRMALPAPSSPGHQSGEGSPKCVRGPLKCGAWVGGPGSKGTTAKAHLLPGAPATGFLQGGGQDGAKAG